MDVFVCAGCGTALTAPVERVPLPLEAHLSYGHRSLPPLMRPGTYAVDPAPSGPPYRLWEETGAERAAGQGVFAPVRSVSFGPRGRIVIAPGEVRGALLVPERSGDSCLGMCAGDEPNMACGGCGRPVASREDDCGMWQTVWFEPAAVRRLSAEGASPAREFEATPAIDPDGHWSPRWEGAAGAALARLLVASGGRPVELPGGLAVTVFARALGALLPSEGPARRAGFAGPGLPGEGLDIALVPYGAPHVGGALPVALPDGMWAGLALPGETSPIPVSGTLPKGVLRDDYPLPDRPRGVFRPDRGLFLRTLARMPEVRRPWLRERYDLVGDGSVSF